MIIFEENIKKWKTVQEVNGKESTTGFYPVFATITYALGLNDIWWILYYVYCLAIGRLPFNKVSIAFFILIEGGHLFMSYLLLTKHRMTQIGYYAALFSIGYLTAHHYTDILSCRNAYEIIFTVIIDWVYCIQFFIMIYFGSVGSLYSKYNKYIVIFICVAGIGSGFGLHSGEICLLNNFYTN